MPSRPWCVCGTFGSSEDRAVLDYSIWLILGEASKQERNWEETMDSCISIYEWGGLPKYDVTPKFMKKKTGLTRKILKPWYGKNISPHTIHTPYTHSLILNKIWRQMTNRKKIFAAHDRVSITNTHTHSHTRTLTFGAPEWLSQLSFWLLI